MSSDYCSETSLYANAKSIVGSIKLFIAKYFYGEISRAERNFSLSLRRSPHHEEHKIKHKRKFNWRLVSPARVERGKPFSIFRWMGGSSVRCSSKHSLAQALWERLMLHYKSVEGMAVMCMQEPFACLLPAPFINYWNIDERRRVLRSRVFYFCSSNCLAFSRESFTFLRIKQSCWETLSCLQVGAVWSEEAKSRKVFDKKKLERKSDQEEKWK